MLNRILIAALLLLIAVPLLAQTEGKKGKRKGAAAKAAAEAKRADAAEDDAEAAEDGADEAIPRVIPVFDPGSHTQPICALGFSSDKMKLITVGEDSSIQIWSTKTGERLDILRLPAYGHEQVTFTKAWDVAAISRDGRLVAIGGGQRHSLSEGNKSDRAKLLVVDVVQRTVRPVNSPQGVVTALAFSPDNRLAVAYGATPEAVLLFPDVSAGEVRRRQSSQLTAPEAEASATFLQFSPDGKHLLAGHGDREVVLWELGAGQPRIKKRFDARGKTSSIAWSPDRQRFARARLPGVRGEHGFEIRSAEGELVQDFLFAKLDGFEQHTDLRFVAYIDPQTLLLCSSDSKGRINPGSFAYRFDLKTGQGKLIVDQDSAEMFQTAGAISADGELGAIAVSMGLDAAIFRATDGRIIGHCGAASPVPTVVGWAKKAESPGFAWSEVRQRRKSETNPQDLEFGFDLTTMEPIAEVRGADYGIQRDSIGDWSIKRVGANQFEVLQKEASKGTIQGGNAVLARTLVPRGADPPLVLWGANRLRAGSSALILSKSDGQRVAMLRPEAVFIRDIAPSPDGRFAVVSTGMHRLGIYATDGRQFPVLSFARVNGEWVAWSGEGYYTASPGGEKMIGWSVSNGPDRLATFHTAEKFSKHFRRPDVLKRAIQLGSIEAALKQEETRAPVLEQLLPPKSELKLLKQTGSHVQVRASATSGAKDKPVVALRMLLDGRPLAAGIGQKEVRSGEKAEATWELDIPAGSHELKLLARSEESSAVSDPLVVKGPKSASQQPVLHRLCVGVDQYALSALNLTSATKDAKDVFAALNKYCVGVDNRFRGSRGALLTDKQATRQSVLDAIAVIRKAAKPGDLVVFLFAGHGIKQQDEYYLMTHEADPSQSLKGKSLSGADLRQALADMECPVLLVMDSCHSAGGVKSFRPATDDLTRSLTDDSAGVTVLAAAMAHEVASATAENGHFTAAFLKALQLGQGVPFDPHEHLLYTHHIYSVVFSEVRKATGGKQNPFLNMPWTVPPLALRDVPRE